MNIEQERAEFEAWYRLHHGSRDVYGRDASGEYADKQVQSAFNVWQARAALAPQHITSATAVRDEFPMLYDSLDALDEQAAEQPERIGTKRHLSSLRASIQAVAQKLFLARARIADLESAAQAPSAAMPDEIEALRAHVALLKAALAQAERENDELRAQPAAATAARRGPAAGRPEHFPADGMV